jgi:hypothetical protein
MRLSLFILVADCFWLLAMPKDVILEETCGRSLFVTNNIVNLKASSLTFANCNTIGEVELGRNCPQITF